MPWRLYTFDSGSVSVVSNFLNGGGVSENDFCDCVFQPRTRKSPSALGSTGLPSTITKVPAAGFMLTRVLPITLKRFCRVFMPEDLVICDVGSVGTCCFEIYRQF